ncbi:unnamed protein product [Blepharisma stoltei]|uniref:Uncharacterized protein n=1 Tax=Blepharisma stoltei TaxID=1481888 RepID=A0AAU9J2P9_9CILI|nr:unnamed protein product [Blepharisma stoltei]
MSSRKFQADLDEETIEELKEQLSKRKADFEALLKENRNQVVEISILRRLRKRFIDEIEESSTKEDEMEVKEEPEVPRDVGLLTILVFSLSMVAFYYFCSYLVRKYSLG